MSALRLPLRLYVLALCCIAALLFAACGGDDDDAAAGGGAEIPEGPIVIGAATAESGALEPYDTGPVRALRQAIIDINAEGGVLGHKLKFVSADTTSDPARGGAAALEVIDQGAVVVATSCDFDYSAGAAQAAAEQDRLAISVCGGSDRFNPDVLGPLVFTMGQRAHWEGNVLAQWAYEQKDFRRAYLLENTSLSYASDKCKGMREVFPTQKGAEVVGESTYKDGDTRFSAQISDIRSTNPDFILLCDGTDGAIPAVKQIRAAGLDTAMLGGSSWDGDYWLAATPGLSNFWYATMGSVFGDDPRPEVNELWERSEERTGEATVTSFDLGGYSLVQAVQLAIERAKSVDGEALSAELEKFNNEPLIIGPQTFTSEWHIAEERPLAIMEVRDGKISYVETYPAEQK
jgi:branched-chain amino acid transport system substrate-binding protein